MVKRGQSFGERKRRKYWACVRKYIEPGAMNDCGGKWNWVMEISNYYALGYLIGFILE